MRPPEVEAGMADPTFEFSTLVSSELTGSYNPHALITYRTTWDGFAAIRADEAFDLDNLQSSNWNAVSLNQKQSTS